MSQAQEMTQTRGSRVAALPEYGCIKGPATVNLELTVRCNLKCKMCQRSSEIFTLPADTDMQMETVRRALPIMKDASCVWLSGFGEPLMHKDLIPIIKMIREVNQTATVAFTTNFILMSEKMITNLIDAGLSRVQVSVDGDNEFGHAFTPTREGVDRYQKMLWERLELLRKAKEEKNVTTPELQFCFVAMKRNVDQLEGIIQRGMTVGLSSIVVQPVRDYDGSLAGEDLYECRAFALPYIERAKQLAEKNGIEFICRFMDDMISVIRQQCEFPWTFFHVSLDGSVYMCCEGISSGLNLNKENVENIWNCEAYIKLRKELSTGKVGRKCWECKLVSPTTNDEKVIAEGLQDQPSEVIIRELLAQKRYIEACHEKLDTEVQSKANSEENLDAALGMLNSVLESRSWRWTRPLRWLGSRAKKS